MLSAIADARKSAIVDARQAATFDARESSIVDARESATVDALESAVVDAWVVICRKKSVEGDGNKKPHEGQAELLQQHRACHRTCYYQFYIISYIRRSKSCMLGVIASIDHKDVCL